MRESLFEVMNRAVQAVQANHGMATVSFAPREKEAHRGAVEQEQVPRQAEKSPAAKAGEQIRAVARLAAMKPAEPMTPRGAAVGDGRKNLANVEILEAMFPESFKEEGRESKCDLCGRMLVWGDLHMKVNLADYGYERKTERICYGCHKEVLEGLAR